MNNFASGPFWTLSGLSFTLLASQYLLGAFGQSRPSIVLPEDASRLARAERLTLERRQQQEDVESTPDPAYLHRLWFKALLCDVLSLLLMLPLLWLSARETSWSNTDSLSRSLPRVRALFPCLLKLIVRLR